MRRATRNLVLFALANVLLVNLGLPRLLGLGRSETGWFQTCRVLSAPKIYRHDSWIPMMTAVWCLRLFPDCPLYDTLFFGFKMKFQYPPTALLAMYPCSLRQGQVPPQSGGVGWLEVLNAISWVLVFATAACVADLLRRLPGSGPGAPESRADRVVRAAAGAALVLTYFPVVYSFGLGQIQVWLNASFAATLWCWVTGRRAAAGVLVGLSCLIKPQSGVLLLWGVLRRQGRFVLAGGIAAAAGLGLSLALFGLGNHLNYFRVLSYIARHGESYYANQSLNGLLHRLLGNGNNLEWDQAAFAPYHPLVHAGTTIGSLALLALGLFGLRRQGRGSALDLGLAALCGTLASPVAWEHHYGVFLPVYAALYAALLSRGAGRAAWWLLGISFALTGNRLAFLDGCPAVPFNLVQSYVFFGGLLAVGLVYRFRSASLGPASTS